MIYGLIYMGYWGNCLFWVMGDLCLVIKELMCCVVWFEMIFMELLNKLLLMKFL